MNIESKYSISTGPILYLAFVFVLSSCLSHNNELHITNCKKVKSIDHLSDSSFFSDVRCMVATENSIYFSDYKRSQIIELKKDDLSVEMITGTYGIGPAELDGVDKFCLKQDTIFAGNDGKRSIDMFVNGVFLKSFKLPEQIRTASLSLRFSVEKNTLYLSASANINPVAGFDYKNYRVKNIGTPFVFSDPVRQRVRNNRHLLLYNDTVLVSISDNMPIIEVFDLEGKLINKYDYSKISVIEKRNKYTSEKQKLDGPNSYYLLVEDVYISGNHLFLLIYTGESGTSCNTILVFNINNILMKPERIIDFGEVWFDSFCVQGDKIWASDVKTSSISEYDITDTEWGKGRRGE
jgi:hypothetical protein